MKIKTSLNQTQKLALIQRKLDMSIKIPNLRCRSLATFEKPPAFLKQRMEAQKKTKTFRRKMRIINTLKVVIIEQIITAAARLDFEEFSKGCSHVIVP